MKNLQIAKALYEMENRGSDFNDLKIEDALKWAYLADVGCKSGLLKVDGNELVRVTISQIDLLEMAIPERSLK